MTPVCQYIYRQFSNKALGPSVVLLFSALTSVGQVLEYKEDVQLDPRKVVTEKQFIIQINKRDMEWLSDVSIPFQETDDVEILEASIIDQNGKPLRTLGKKEFTKRHNISEGTFHEDSWVYQFKLKWGQYPYRIRYRYREESKQYIYACRWTPLIYSAVPTEQAYLTVSYPKGFPVKIYQTGDMKSDSLVEKDRVRRNWEIKNVKPVIRETLSPPIITQLPAVMVAPRDFSYGVAGSLSSWKSYGDWNLQLNANITDLPPLELQNVQKLSKEAKDKKELMRKLYHYMQDNTRYINISMNVGGLRAYSASYVSAKKYGDCKALTVYMQALLQAAGINSYYAHVNGGDNIPGIVTQVPGPQFNHMILCVPFEADTLWLENTSAANPFGYLGTFTQNRQALLIEPGNSKLVRTPALSSAQVLCERTYQIKLQPDGKATAQATLVLRGDEFETFRSLQLVGTESEMKEQLEEMLPGTFKLLKWSLQQENRDKPEITITLELEMLNATLSLGGSLAIRPVSIPFRNLEAPAKRTLPVQLELPLNEIQATEYDLSSLSMETGELPKAVNIKSEFGTYTIQFSKADDRVRIERTLTIAAGTIPLARYADFYSFVQSIREADRTSTVILNPKK